MYVVSTTPDGSVLDVFDPDVYLDEGVAVFPITDAEFEMLRQYGDNGRWMLAGGKIVPKPEPEPDELAERNYLLAESDWTQLPDARAAMGAEKAAEWDAYRQALRDISEQPGFPTEIVWPIKPT